jgi:hypothetical protein
MLLAGCTTAAPTEPAKPAAPSLDPKVTSNPFPSTYKAFASEPTAFVGATAFTGAGSRIENATILVKDGKIESIASGAAAPAGYKVVDAKGKFITPGIIDAHSHLGVYPQPGVRAHSDGNEAISPNTAQVWAEHSVWPQDEGFNAVRRGGVTAMLVLPGSANLFGGRTVTLKNVPSVTMQGMKFPDAPYGLKMACGENPKRVYGSRAVRHQPAWATLPAIAPLGSRRLSTRASGTPGVPAAARAKCPAVTSSLIRWPVCSRARSSSRTIATAPTKWRS